MPVLRFPAERCRPTGGPVHAGAWIVVLPVVQIDRVGEEDFWDWARTESGPAGGPLERRAPGEDF